MKIKTDKQSEINSKLEELKKQLEAEMNGSAEIKDVEGGLITLLNKQVLILTAGYFYIGKLTGVNDQCIELENAWILYNAEDFSPSKWKKENMDKLPSKKWGIQIEMIESWGEAASK